ncbi:hypothetical protein CBS101457_002326 [Exobasidium rhododendri]|nr:hypothetical protein CBS101457_002326 [Exobasidium rhododendri]
MSASSSSSSLTMSLRGLWHPAQYPDMIVALYNRAPASFMTFTSIILSYLANAAYLDYSLYKAIGEGGLGKPNFLKWLAHTFILRPLSMSLTASQDPDYLPPDDADWNQRVKADGKKQLLSDLPLRARNRPEVFGLIPHRQIEDVEKEGSVRQKEIIDHLKDLASRFPSSLTLSLSAFEATTSPCLFVTHSSGTGQAAPTRLAKILLAGNPPPKKTLEGVIVEERDYNQHEVAHIHTSEGSMHLVLSPQDARRVITQNWGELHRMSGLFYRGFYLPPYWLPSWLYNFLGGQSKLRWGYLQRIPEHHKAKLIPPTYCIVYAPNNEEQARWVKAIIDSSISWATGQPL